MDGYSVELERQMSRLYKSLNERDRRRYAAAGTDTECWSRQSWDMVESNTFHAWWGVIPDRFVMGFLKWNPLMNWTHSANEKRGGRKPLSETSPHLVENFLKVLCDHTAGDPMRADVKWTNLSRRQISRRLNTLGTPAGKNVVSRLLWEHGYRRRKPQKSRTMGEHADRNAQFEKIAELKQQYLAVGHPVVSIDTKKKAF